MSLVGTLTCTCGRALARIPRCGNTYCRTCPIRQTVHTDDLTKECKREAD